jgi:hypothetical protein
MQIYVPGTRLSGSGIALYQTLHELTGTRQGPCGPGVRHHAAGIGTAARDPRVTVLPITSP